MGQIISSTISEHPGKTASAVLVAGAIGASGYVGYKLGRKHGFNEGVAKMTAKAQGAGNEYIDSVINANVKTKQLLQHNSEVLDSVDETRKLLKEVTQTLLPQSQANTARVAVMADELQISRGQIKSSFKMIEKDLEVISEYNHAADDYIDNADIYIQELIQICKKGRMINNRVHEIVQEQNLHVDKYNTAKNDYCTAFDEIKANVNKGYKSALSQEALVTKQVFGGQVIKPFTQDDLDKQKDYIVKGYTSDLYSGCKYVERAADKVGGFINDVGELMASGNVLPEQRPPLGSTEDNVLTYHDANV